MIGGLSVLGLIPARGGSKGIPRKNLRRLGGKPLLQWTAEAARASGYLDSVILSTDDPEIEEFGSSLGIDVPFRRPVEHATDEAPAAQVILHALGALDRRYDLIVYLQPTSPFRTSDDIDRAIERLVESGVDACVSVHEAPLRADLLFYADADGRLEPVTGSLPAALRQRSRPCFVLNGAVYVALVQAFERDRTFLTERTVAYVMPVDRSLDLDKPADFELAEVTLERGGFR
jgi:N-acylneuraminate cytidylyltransferase